MDGIDSEIAAEAAGRSIRRLCHSTRVASLPLIADHGLLSRNRLEEECIPCVINDRYRADGQLGHISCSVELPNAYYMQSAVRSDSPWVVLLIDPAPISRTTTLYCRYNAATASGADIRPGLAGFRSLFAEQVDERWRGRDHVLGCPTDLQAEILVEGQINTELIHSVVVETREIATTHRAVLESFTEATGTRLSASEQLFDPYALNSLKWRGRLPNLTPITW